MQPLIETLVASLAAEEKLIRPLLPFAFDVLEKFGLLRVGHVPQRLFVDRAASVYEEAATQLELDALQKSLWALYAFYAKHQPTLLPPSQFLPVRAPAPFWRSDKPTVSLCVQLVVAAENGVEHPDLSIRFISMLLLLARQTGLRSVKRLKALCQANEFIVLQDAKRALYHDEKGWVILDGVALLLLRRLQQHTNCLLILSQIGKHFSAWLTTYSFISSTTSSQDALSALSFLDSPICGTSLSPLATALSHDAMMAALTGCMPKAGDSDTGGKRRSLKAAKLPAVFEANDEMSSWAIGSGEYDLNAFRQLNFVLEQFRHDEPLGRRNSAAFKLLKNELQALERECLSRCSIVVRVIISYSINLFLTGSAWKPELAASTVKQYASTLKVFAEQCWSDNALLHDAQLSSDALYTLTEHVIDAFDNILAADRQNTVSNFCQFITQRLSVRLFDEAGLEYIGADRARTRAHFISSQLFEAALQDFLTASSSPLNLQTLWFLRLCYYLGLRHTEAANLHIVDITDDWLYVTRRESRKSRAAVRRVSLCFMPPELCTAFLQWVKQRKHSSTLLFDKSVVDYFSVQALQFLRQHSGISNLVVHSLRHCAANNMIWLLSMAAFERLDWRERYYFCRARLYSDESILLIRAMFSSLGRRLTPHSSLLEFVASQLGHCSPAVTAASYLHLLDLLCWELNFVRTLTPVRASVLPLLGDNNHRFSVWPKGEQYSESVIFCNAVHGLKGCHRFSIDTLPREVKATETLSIQLTFSEYVYYLIEYYTSSDVQIDESLRAHFVQNFRDVDLGYLYSNAQTAAWLSLVEQINSIKWTRPNINAVVTTRLALEQRRVRDIRTLRHVLQTCQLLEFKQTSLLFRRHSNRGLPPAWHALAQRYQLKIKEVIHQDNSTQLDLTFLTKSTAKAQKFRLALQLTNTFINYMKEIAL